MFGLEVDHCPYSPRDELPARRSPPTALAVAVCVALVAPLGSCHRGSKQPPARPPVPVTVERAEQRSVPLEIEAIGTATPVSTIGVRSQVGGTIDRVLFREGDEVAKGQLLFVIDPRPFRLAIEQAQAALARDEAQARNAEADAARYQKLLPTGVVSQQDYDLKVAQARALRAAVNADRAAVDTARVNLSYTQIRAPIAARTSSLQVNAGNVIKANDTLLVVLRQIRPIYVAFSVPASSLPEVRRQAGQHPLQALAAIPGQQGEERGTLDFIDNAVDTTTGTIMLRATFPNESSAIWPGQFVNVRLVLATIPEAVVIAARAVQPGQQGDHVFVVGSDLVAQSRPVKTGQRVGDHVVVTEGIRAGEQVVVDGLLGLVPGAKVQLKGPPEKAEATRAER